MIREMAELWSDAIGAAGTVVRYGHFGRAVLVFPSEQGRAWDFEHNGMVAAVAGLLEAGRVKLYCVDSYDAASWSDQAIPLEERAPGTAATSRGSSARCCRGSTPTAAAPLRLRPSAAVSAASTLPTSRSVARTCSRWRCASPGSTIPAPGTRGASGAVPPTSTTRWTTSGTCTVTISTGSAAASACCWSAAQGQWEDTTGSLLEHDAVRRAASRQGHQARAGPVGDTARLAGLARPAGPPPAEVLLMAAVGHVAGPAAKGDPNATAPDRAAARHGGGLAAGFRGDHAPRWHVTGPDGTRHGIRHRADHDRAVRAAGPAALPAWSSTGSPTGTTSRASG